MAALIGDRTRARILSALMDGAARTATELALVGGVTPSTASSHLGLLTEAGVLGLVKQGRHRYYRIASADAAAAIEALMAFSASGGASAPRSGPKDPALRYARVCYDHLAGEAAVRLLERLRASGMIDGGDDAMRVTLAGERWCTDVGIEVDALKRRRRPLCLACLDWSERRTHLAGAIGAALLDLLLTKRMARRVEGGRTVLVARSGEAFVEQLRLRASVPQP